MPFVPKALPSLLLAVGTLLGASLTVRAAHPEPQTRYAEALDAQYRGCESAGWCRFWIRSLDPSARSAYRVYPEGVPRAPGDDTIATAVRDRLNALLAGMIHQHKRIVLHDLREVGHGGFAATVTVNDVNLASDPILLQLRERLERSAP